MNSALAAGLLGIALLHKPLRLRLKSQMISLRSNFFSSFTTKNRLLEFFVPGE
jgi:hypothetical protein